MSTDTKSSDYVEIINDIMDGAGWCTDDYLINFASENYTKSALSKAAIKLAEVNLLFDESKLSEEEMNSSKKPSIDKKVTMEEAKKIEF